MKRKAGTHAGELPQHPEEWLRDRGYIPRKDGAWGAYQRGTCFSCGQMEWFTPPLPDYEADGMFGVVELETGQWQANLHLYSPKMPDLFGPLYPTRTAALEAAVRKVERTLTSHVIGYAIGNRWFSPVCGVSRGRAERIIAWACGIAGIEPIPIPARHPLQPPPPNRFAAAGPLFAGLDT